MPAAACLVTAPLIAGLSGGVSLVTVVANLLAAPAVAPATVLGVLAAVLSPVSRCPRHRAVRWLAGPAVGWLVAGRGPGGGGARRRRAVAGRSRRGACCSPWSVLGRRAARRLAGGSGRCCSPWSSGCCWCWCPTRVVRAGLAAVRTGRWWPATSGRATRSSWRPGEPGRAVLVDAGPDDGPVDACLDRLGVRGARPGAGQPPARRPHRRARRRAARPAGRRGRGRSGPRAAVGAAQRVAAAGGRGRRPVVELAAGHAGCPGRRCALDVLGPAHPPRARRPGRRHRGQRRLARAAGDAPRPARCC